jgi:hypothetical protein
MQMNLAFILKAKAGQEKSDDQAYLFIKNKINPPINLRQEACASPCGLKHLDTDASLS